jgi:hypothetical protein
MLHCGPTVVGAGFEGVAQPALTGNEISNRSAKCFAKITAGFIGELLADGSSVDEFMCLIYRCEILVSIPQREEYLFICPLRSSVAGC